MANPRCNQWDCFANRTGKHCDILDSKIYDEVCPFYKTDAQLDSDRMKAHKRLKDMGREDLIRKYEYNPQRKW